MNPDRRTPNRKPLIGYLILVVAIALAFFSVYQTNQEIDETNHKQDQALKAIFCLARNNTLTSQQRTPEQKARTVAFYDEALRLLEVGSCQIP